MSNIKNILLDVPDIDSSPDCFDTVKRLAKKLSAQLTLMTVLPSFSDLLSIFETDEMRSELLEDLKQQATSVLRVLEGDLREQNIACSSYVTRGNHVRRLIAKVLKHDHDLLVKDAGTQEVGGQAVFDSVDHKLVRHSPCPVWFLRGDDYKDSTSAIAVAVDTRSDGPLEKELNRRLIRYAKCLSDFYDSPLKILSVWDFDSSRFLKGSVEQDRYLELERDARTSAKESLSRFCIQNGLTEENSSQHLAEGTPSKQIVKFCKSQQISTLVIGTVGRSGISGYLVGNTAERVLGEISCSALVVSPAQVRSPLEVKLTEVIDEITFEGLVPC